MRVTLAATLVLGVLAFPATAQEQPVKAEATFSPETGYARLVLKFSEDVTSEVTTAGSIIVIRFARPVAVPIDGLEDSVPGYIGSVRRDPDGTAIRLALARRVTINTMTAGERLFVDLLPDSWKGPPPSLPAEVVRELSERARAAERELRQQRALSDSKKRTPIRVRASVQPTFVRFIFEMPDGVGISSVLNEQKLRLQFSKGLVFDLADAKIAAPPNVAAITQKVEGDTSAVEILLLGDVDVHSFREDKNYNIDVAFQQPDKQVNALPSVAEAAHAPEAHSAAASNPPPIPAPAPAAGPASAPASIPAAMTPAAAPEKAASAPVPQASETHPAIAAEKNAADVEGRGEQAVANPPASESHATPPPASGPTDEKPAAMAEAPPSMAVAAPAAHPAAEPSAAPAPIGSESASSDISVIRDSEGLHLTFALPPETAAALFRRADAVWLIIDSTRPINIEPLRGQGEAAIAEVSLTRLERGQAIRFRLNRPQLPALSGENIPTGTNWTVTFADVVQTPQQALIAIRNIAEPSLANVTVPLPNAGHLHRFVDPDAGDTLLVVTAMPPSRGFVRRQDFVEFSLLESIHGVAIRPNSDEVTTQVAADKITLAKPGGLTLSPAATGAERAPTAVRPIFDLGEWHKNLDSHFAEREDALIAAAGAASSGSLDQRTQAQLDLARFYMARGLYPEASGVLDLSLNDVKPGQEDPAVLIVHAVANILVGRPERGLKDIANPLIGNNYDSQLWKAMASARVGKWADAREKFKNSELSVTSLPIELQRVVLKESMRASIEVRDYPGAAKRASELEVIGASEELQPAVSVLRGRLAEGLGHEKDALDEYRSAVESSDPAAATEAKLLEIALKQKRDEISRDEALRELETLAITWRGDALEVQSLEMLAKIYADSGRFAESFAAVKVANILAPNIEVARQGQDAAAALFAQLFLSPKGDDLPPIDALGLFFEYRDLTPIGRRGDEMIRRLADRLVAVDLLDQAAELLQYQVDKRLEGAARAQVAARLAMVYLTSHKPERAIAALRSTRIADLSGELRQQRLLLEARAQSDVGRHDLALDIISNINGREAIRLRSDIYWAARKWRESAEQIELYYADRWRDFKPLSAVEKSDIIRAVVGYALADDVIGMGRFREKYAPLMSDAADRTAFQIASKPVDADGADFAAIAKLAASVDTLDGFLHDMRTRFPDATARATMPPGTQKADSLTTGSLPAIVGEKPVRAAR